MLQLQRAKYFSITRGQQRTSFATDLTQFLLGLALLAALPGAASAQSPPPLHAPVTPACISSPFGWRHAVGPHAPAGFHNGIDLPAAAGAYVHAAAPGQVVVIRRMGIGGLQVQIRHGSGADAIVTLYAHLGSVVPALADGRRMVAAGDPIGRVGRTGITYGTHVFFAVFVHGEAVDPKNYLDVDSCR